MTPSRHVKALFERILRTRTGSTQVSTLQQSCSPDYSHISISIMGVLDRSWQLHGKGILQATQQAHKTCPLLVSALPVSLATNAWGK